jgi:hypothetical protein
MKHKDPEKCECSRWERPNSWIGEPEAHHPHCKVKHKDWPKPPPPPPPPPVPRIHEIPEYMDRRITKSNKLSLWKRILTMIKGISKTK